VLIEFNSELFRQAFRISRRIQSHGQHNQVKFFLFHPIAGRGVSNGDVLAFRDFTAYRYVAPDEPDPGKSFGSLVKPLEVFPVSSDIVVEYRTFRIRVVIFGQNDLFLGIRATYCRTVAVPPSWIDLSRADALNPGDLLGMGPIGGAQNFTIVGSGGTHQPLVVHAGHHVLELSVAVFIPHAWIKWLESRCQDDRPDFYFYFLRRLVEIDGIVLTYSFANATLLLLQIKTAFINVGDKGYSLGEIDMDSLVGRYLLIEWVRVYDRTIFDTGCTTGAFVFLDVPGFSEQGNTKIPCTSFYRVDFCIGEDFDVWVPADLDQFRSKNSYGAIVGREGLVELGHMAANGRSRIYQIDFIP
jgi:hypothetical protein